MKTLHIMTIIAVCAPLWSCGGGIDNPKSSAAIDSAAAHGRLDAMIVADSTATVMDRERAIFSIRYKEAHMRAMGYDEAADAYIKAAEEVIPDSITKRSHEL